MSTIPITISGDMAQVQFRTFDLAEYGHFLTLKKTLPTPEMDLSYDWDRDIYTVQFPARYAASLGVEVLRDLALLPMSPDMWDYQRHFVSWALKRKRAAFFWDCGLGKTRAFLEFARQAMHMTGRKALIVSIAGNLISQTIRQAQRFYGDSLPILRIETREQLIEWLRGEDGALHRGTEYSKHQGVQALAEAEVSGNGHCGQSASGVHSAEGNGREICRAAEHDRLHRSNRLAIVNYEKFIPGQIPELRNLGALILDESSILKTGGGKIKWNLIHSAKGIEYKLSNTATPAPNEAMEYASQASFLETIRTEGDVIWTYFKKNDDGSWRLIKHAEKAFYKFLAGWSVFMRSPAAYGFKDNIKPVPKPEYILHNIPATPEQLTEAQRYRFEIGAGLLGHERMGVKERLKLSQIAKGFIYEPPVNGNQRSARLIPSLKPRRIAELALSEILHHRQVIIWTVFDEEGEIISRELGDVPHRILSGKTPAKIREKYIDEYLDGFPCLISKAELLGYGMNLEQGSAMIFSGWNDSFEQWYQAIRRMVRYGQTERVHVHVPMIDGLEDAQLENVQAKAAAYEEQAELQEEAYREALGEIA